MVSRGEARAADLDQALRLEYFTIGWNALEAVVGMTAGLAAGSVALVGFALDSLVEASSGGILAWRLHSEKSGRRSAEDVERRAVRGVAVAFLLLAVYVIGRSVLDLVTRARPEESPLGVGLAVVSLAVMPLLARAKRRTAKRLDSRALEADSTQTWVCTYLSAALLIGLLANAALGLWWADPLAGMAIAGFAAKEGAELWRSGAL